MKGIKWFDRKFEFNFGIEHYTSLLERLKQAPAALKAALGHTPEDILQYKPGGKWSLNEHVGHLIVLEELWQERLFDFEMEKPELTPADLNNNATEAGNFNNYDIETLLEKFTEVRNKTLELLEDITDEELQMTSVHPRLKQPMRLIDHLYFVVEHDEHHINYIKENAIE